MIFSQKINILVTNFVIFYLISGVFSNSLPVNNEEFLGRANLGIIFRYLEPVKFLERYTSTNSLQNRSACDTDLGLYYGALQKLELWALKSKLFVSHTFFI